MLIGLATELMICSRTHYGPECLEPGFAYFISLHRRYRHDGAFDNYL